MNQPRVGEFVQPSNLKCVHCGFFAYIERDGIHPDGSVRYIAIHAGGQFNSDCPNAGRRFELPVLTLKEA